MPSDSPLLLFYPTSPVHVRDFRQVVSKLVGWRFQALAYEPQLRLVPGISAVLLEQRTKTLTLDKGSNLDTELPTNVSILVIGAVFESFVLDLIAWARFRSIPVAAIEEVAQLGLNQNYPRKVVPDAVVIGREMPMDELLAMTDVLVNRGNSQICFESILRGIPTLIAACGLQTLFHETGRAYVFETTDALVDAIVRASSAPAAGDVKLKIRHLFS